MAEAAMEVAGITAAAGTIVAAAGTIAAAATAADIRNDGRR
jgi:hypothetical protein